MRTITPEPSHDLTDGKAEGRVLSATMIGWDLQLVRMARTDSAGPSDDAHRYAVERRAGSVHFQLFDASGNYLTTLATGEPGQITDAEVAAVIELARAMYPTFASHAAMVAEEKAEARAREVRRRTA